MSENNVWFITGADRGMGVEFARAALEAQLAVTLLGPMNVTRAVLPVMRSQRSGHIISISSGAGLAGFEFNSAYAASKFRSASTSTASWRRHLRSRRSPLEARARPVGNRTLVRRNAGAGRDVRPPMA